MEGGTYGQDITPMARMSIEERPDVPPSTAQLYKKIIDVLVVKEVVVGGGR